MPRASSASRSNTISDQGADGGYRAARAEALRAAAMEARDPRSVASVVSRLAACNLGAELVGYVDGLGPLDRIPVPLLMTMARHCSLAGDQVRALRYLDEVHRADPDFPPGLLARAQVLMYFGRIADARRDVERCLLRAPEIAQAHWLRSRLDGHDPSVGHVDQARALLSATANGQDQAFLGFALHTLLDGLADHAGAWSALERACQAKRGLLQYDPAGSRQLVDALIAMPAGPAADAAAMDGSKVPIFIVGMHRSGTTLLEQMLDGSPQVRGVGERYDFTSAMQYATDHHCHGVVDTTIIERVEEADFAEVGRQYLEGMAWRLGEEPFFIDKLPSNFLNIGFICRALPGAKILHMVREPMETCFSNLRELFSDANPYSYDQAELADYFLQYRRLMAHWHATYPDRILDVRYAGLSGDPAMEMKRVAAFCGVDWVPAMLESRNEGRAVATASAVQVRERVSRRAVPKWTPYAPYLQPMAGLVKAAMLQCSTPGQLQEA